MNDERAFVSVIIPVFNDSERLKNCLISLEQQSYPTDSYEVIAVDNASKEDVKAVINQFSHAKYFYEAYSGSYAARNRGISVAHGEIVAFTDSDCIPRSDWIEKGVNRLSTVPGCGMVAGRINFFFKDPGCPTTAELFDSLTYLNQEKYIEEEHYGATANVFTFTEVFKKVGLFNAELKSGGDREWGKRVHAAGYLQVYADEVCISHPARHSINALKTKVLRVVEGQYFSDSSKKTTVTAFKEFLRDAKPYLGYAIRVFNNREARNFGYKLGIIRIHIVLRCVRAWKKFQLNFQ